MKSGLRTGILSDKSVLISCADQQSIPFNKINLAARSGTKISRPQKSIYMFNNLNITPMQKEELINDFVLRSQKAKPLVIPPRIYSTLSLDKQNALVRQVVTQTLANDLARDQINAVVGLGSVASDDESVSQLTTRPGSPEADYPYSDNEDETDANVPEPDGDTGLPTTEERIQSYNLRRGQIFGRNAFGVTDPMAMNPSINAPPRVPTELLQSRITGFGPQFQPPQPLGGRVNRHTHFISPAGSGLSAADSMRSTNGNGNGSHYADPIMSGGTSRGPTSRMNLMTGDVVDRTDMHRPMGYRP